MFFRHGRFFIMAFVAHRSSDVIAATGLTLSNDEKTLLSRRTNELAEMIYAESVPMQAFKGYLSIFRNLTDSQPLADRVLERLQKQDEAATPAPSPQSTTTEQP